MARTKIYPKSIYQLKVTLKDINPPIWRRILVSPSTSLFQLHDILQLAMGWMDSHLHEFTKDETHYQPPEEDPEEFDLALVNSDLEDIENAWYRIPKS